MADATIRERYGLKAGATWGGTFSDVSVENVLLWVVAACCHVVEVLTEKWAADVEARMASAEDVELGDCQYMTATGTAWTTIKGNNYTAAGGSLTVEGLENSMSYVVES